MRPRAAVALGAALALATLGGSEAMTRSEMKRHSDEVVSIFDHAFGAYMTHAYPADELMPLSCKGRVRGVDPSRGDIDDALGNFSLTLIDSLDSLAVMGMVDELCHAVRLVTDNVRFDADFVVSVFETNIRVLGGLLGGHTAMISLREKPGLVAKHPCLNAYNDQLLTMAHDVGSRLLLAFNTATGLPYSRINLRRGLDDVSRRDSATCTACAGTMLLEFGALSRFTGDPRFERAARRAMEALWSRRAHHTGLVGETINVTTGAWARTDSGIGAGIDSYYEYLFKSYILFGDDTYFKIFELHYDSVMQLLRQGPFIFHANMNQPAVIARKHLDSLQMFWPGLQVLHGDIGPAKEMHRMHFELTKRYGFSPEGYTTEFKVHWGNWPLRPEFIESTYFLHRATKDPFYLEVGRQMLENLQEHARVECGFAAILDVRQKSHEDKMDSFFLAETLKYLYLLFTDHDDLVLDMDDFVLSTEAHLLPLSLAQVNTSHPPFSPVGPLPPAREAERSSNAAAAATEPSSSSSSRPHGRAPPVCKTHAQPWGRDAFMSLVRATPESWRCSVNAFPLSKAGGLGRRGGGGGAVPAALNRGGVPYDPQKFVAPDQLNLNRREDVEFLNSMGIYVEAVEKGFRLTHHSGLDRSGGKGLAYMQTLIGVHKNEERASRSIGTATVKFASPAEVEGVALEAGQASFGVDLDERHTVFGGRAVIAEPIDGCTPLLNAEQASKRVVVVKRGKCMFIDKVRQVQRAGADSVVVVDTRAKDANAKPFTMSGDGVDDVDIPAVFVDQQGGDKLIDAIIDHGDAFTVEIYSSKWDD